MQFRKVKKQMIFIIVRGSERKEKVIKMEYLKNCNENLVGIYKEIADSAGIETAILMHKNFQGQQIAFPKKLYKTAYIIEEIKEKYDGKNIRKLASEYGYTERWLRKLIKESD